MKLLNLMKKNIQKNKKLEFWWYLNKGFTESLALIIIIFLSISIALGHFGLYQWIMVFAVAFFTIYKSFIEWLLK
ncbi:MAG: hypothetical protein AABX71_00845 [Nanoarchaeota archaeon]